MATKMRQKKYLHHEFIGEHYYQNQDTNKVTKSSKNNYNKNKNNMIMRPSSRPSSGGASPPTIPSSTVSSNRTLIMNDQEKAESDIAFCFLTLAIFCLVFSVIAIAITFIFPFWFRITISSDSESLNLTNVDNNIDLYAMSSSNNTTIIYIDMGIWEVKLNQQIELIDNNSNRYKSQFPQSMLWLNGDDLFLEKLIKFINLKTSHLFIIQTLEILHLIFTFLTFTFSSFTVCLTGNANTNKSLCWYFVCFIMSLVAFLSGLAVIILIILWQNINTPLLRDETGHRTNVKKELGWTFWTSVGILSLILLAGSLLLLHILIQSLIYYFRSKKISKHNRLMLKQKNNDKYLFTANGIVSANGNVSNEVFQANNYSNLNSSKLSRSQATSFPPPPLPILPSSANIRGSKTIPPIEEPIFKRNTIDNKNNIDRFLNAQHEFNSPSYIFYTGHGQYRKQSISIDTNDNQIQLLKQQQQQQQQLDYDLTNDSIQQHQHNYTLMNSSNYTNNNNNNNTTDHPYSNVNDQNQINQNELTRYMNYR